MSLDGNYQKEIATVLGKPLKGSIVIVDYDILPLLRAMFTPAELGDEILYSGRTAVADVLLNKDNAEVNVLHGETLKNVLEQLNEFRHNCSHILHSQTFADGESYDLLYNIADDSCVVYINPKLQQLMFERRRKLLDVKMAGDRERAGFTVMAVSGVGCYTIGLCSHGLPELLISGTWDSKPMHAFISEVANRILANGLKALKVPSSDILVNGVKQPGKWRIDAVDMADVTQATVSTKHEDNKLQALVPHLALSHYSKNVKDKPGDEGFGLLQLVWADGNNVLPGQRKFKDNGAPEHNLDIITYDNVGYPQHVYHVIETLTTNA